MRGVGHGVAELRDEDTGFWYRLFYWPHSGWIYVLHCFAKKTNKTSKRDIATARQRMKEVMARKDPPAKPLTDGDDDEDAKRTERVR